ncbi:hypothetical protein LCGC14_2369460 [marine sediment metagenome]|uniref:Uncharacterized protein n=1 Tax=marine sediment metagenome TaxID=412755 RepID=A0A0F9C4B5_9ZZZZ
MSLILDILIWGILTIVIGSVVGIVIGKFYFSILKKQEGKRAIQFLLGNRPNNLKLDGEVINVNKFVVKANSGKIIKMGIGMEIDKFEVQDQGEEIVKIGVEDIIKNPKKTQPEASKSEKMSLFKRIFSKSDIKGRK